MFPPVTICRQRVAHINRLSHPPECLLATGSKVSLAPLIALSRRALHIYLFRDEYIFELERAVVVETPQLGNATYLFTKPKSMDAFLAAYTRVSKDNIRRNRANIGEKLGFICRIIHGCNPRSWAKELRKRIGETPDFAEAAVPTSAATDTHGHYASLK